MGRIRAAMAGDIGRRPTNQDLAFVGDGVYIVCDGMGGGVGGQRASAAAVDRFRELDVDPIRPLEHIRSALSAAHDDVLAIGEELDGICGTTLTGLVLPYTEKAVPHGRHARRAGQDGSGEGNVECPDSCYVLNIGDSRTYHLSRGADGWDPNTLYRITHDHSQRQEAIDSGRLLPQEALSIPRNIITQCLGDPEGIHPDIYAVDCSGRFIACSDGLHGEVDDAAIARIAARYDEPQEAADALVHVALLSGGRDNVSVVVVDAPSDTSDGVWQAVRLVDGEDLGEIADCTLDTARTRRPPDTGR